MIILYISPCAEPVKEKELQNYTLTGMLYRMMKYEMKYEMMKLGTGHGEETKEFVPIYFKLLNLLL